MPERTESCQPLASRWSHPRLETRGQKENARPQMDWVRAFIA